MNTLENQEKVAISESLEKFRETSQFLLPAEKKQSTSGKYDIYPTFKIEDGAIHAGFGSLADWIAAKNANVVLEGYTGVYWSNFIKKLDEQLVQKGIKVSWVNIEAALKSEPEIEQMISPYMGGDDPIFGKAYKGDLKDFFDEAKLNDIKPMADSITILYGSGAALARWKAPLVYIDVPKNEIQFRSRSGHIRNMGASTPVNAKIQYKRFYFIEWQVLNRHKQALLPTLDVVVDEQRIEEISWAEGDVFRNVLKEMSQHMFRVRPWFEPGVWGGQWIKDNIEGLNKDVVNYAWSFELIVPENGIILESDRKMLEVSFDFLMFSDNRAILGKAADRFQYEFPIRFDFLDTVRGDNLSVQCHPSLKYIQENFGERFTQDETYYILDVAENANVYLGFQEDINIEEFKTVLENSFATNTPIDVEKYVQVFPAKKHDLFLIPNGTIHCSGINNMVLEISATPYIFTFKMYDWVRLDLNGQPRPLNIDRAFDNLRFERKGEIVHKELISRQTVVQEGEDWQLINLTTHPEHFYAVQRVEFDSTVEVKTESQCHILSLVEGSSILVKTGNLEQVINYAETFVIPAAAESYTLVNRGDKKAKVVKAFVKDESC